jgi:hypothetical protein
MDLCSEPSWIGGRTNCGGTGVEELQSLCRLRVRHAMTTVVRTQRAAMSASATNALRQEARLSMVTLPTTT